MLNYLGIYDFMTLEPLSKFGVVFLLFLVGLRLNLHEIKEMGAKLIILSLLQFFCTSAAFAIFIAYFFDFTMPQVLILAGALSFSSTIVATKIIYEKDEANELYAKIAFAVLILQDIIAIALIMIARTLGQSCEQLVTLKLLELLIRITAAFLALSVSLKILPHIEKHIHREAETLFLFAVAFVLLFASFFEAIGIGMELGALSAGIILSSSVYQREISSRIEPVKNIFLG